MHDRRIDNVPHVFGNDGALFMNAMTWFDHETDSAWAQPWGRALSGELKGVELQLLPFELTSWGQWRRTHPQTLVMTNDIARVADGRQEFRAGFVIGIVIGSESRAYQFEDIVELGVVNDALAEIPILVWAAGDQYHAYGRQVGDRLLTFVWENGVLRDAQTGSTWDPARGLALDGPLRGQALQSIPNMSAFDWAFRDFYPESDLYSPDGN